MSNPTRRAAVFCKEPMTLSLDCLRPSSAEFRALSESLSATLHLVEDFGAMTPADISSLVCQALISPPPSPPAESSSALEPRRSRTPPEDELPSTSELLPPIEAPARRSRLPPVQGSALQRHDRTPTIPAPARRKPIVPANKRIVLKSMASRPMPDASVGAVVLAPSLPALSQASVLPARATVTSALVLPAVAPAQGVAHVLQPCPSAVVVEPPPPSASKCQRPQLPDVTRHHPRSSSTTNNNASDPTNTSDATDLQFVAETEQRWRGAVGSPMTTSSEAPPSLPLAGSSTPARTRCGGVSRGVDTTLVEELRTIIGPGIGTGELVRLLDEAGGALPIAINRYLDGVPTLPQPLRLPMTPVLRTRGHPSHDCSPKTSKGGSLHGSSGTSGSDTGAGVFTPSSQQKVRAWLEQRALEVNGHGMAPPREPQPPAGKRGHGARPARLTSVSAPMPPALSPGVSNSPMEMTPMDELEYSDDFCSLSKSE